MCVYINGIENWDWIEVISQAHTKYVSIILELRIEIELKQYDWHILYICVYITGIENWELRLNWSHIKSSYHVCVYNTKIDNWNWIKAIL